MAKSCQFNEMKFIKWVTFRSFLVQIDEAFWVSGSSGSLSVTRLQCWGALDTEDLFCLDKKQTGGTGLKR